MDMIRLSTSDPRPPNEVYVSPHMASQQHFSSLRSHQTLL